MVCHRRRTWQHEKIIRMHTRGGACANRNASMLEVKTLPLAEVVEKYFPGVSARTLREEAQKTGFGSKVGGKWFFLPDDIVGLMKACRSKSNPGAENGGPTAPSIGRESDDPLRRAITRSRCTNAPSSRKNSKGKQSSAKKSSPRLGTPAIDTSMIIPFQKAKGTK